MDKSVPNHEDVVLLQMQEELRAMTRVQEKNSDWLRYVENSPDRGVLDMLSKIGDLQFDTEEGVLSVASGFSFRVSEVKKEEKNLSQKMKKLELEEQLETLRESRKKVKEEIQSLKTKLEEMKVTSEKRKKVLDGVKDQGQGHGGGDLENYLKDKYAPEVIFDEEKAAKILAKLDSVQEEKKILMKRLTTDDGKYSLPSIPIPANIYVAQDEFKERKNYLMELQEKLETKTTDF